MPNILGMMKVGVGVGDNYNMDADTMVMLVTNQLISIIGLGPQMF